MSASGVGAGFPLRKGSQQSSNSRELEHGQSDIFLRDIVKQRSIEISKKGLAKSL